MAAKARVKDPESARAMEADLLEANEYLELNAALGMAAMLLVSTQPPQKKLYCMNTALECISQTSGHSAVQICMKQTLHAIPLLLTVPSVHILFLLSFLCSIPDSERLQG